MNSAYLELAVRVLKDAREPMSPGQIMERGYALGVVPWHLHGKTQAKTLHARLSENIASLRERSEFYRTAPGIFYLSSLRSNPETPSEFHLAPPRRKDLRKGFALCLFQSDLTEVEFGGRIEAKALSNLFRMGRFRYARKADVLAKSSQFIPVSSFAVVFSQQSILSFRSGKFVRLDEDYSPTRSIGFGDVVSDEDNDLLYESVLGIKESAIRELIYGIGLEQEDARSARYEDKVKFHFGVLTTDADLKFLKVVLGFNYSSPQPVLSRSLSFGDMRWISSLNKPNDLHAYDEASLKIIQNGWLTEIATVAG